MHEPGNELMDKAGPDISVFIATHQRARQLRETLERMATIDRTGLEVEWVVIDNASTDDTREVILSFQGRMPIHYFYEARPGKNCALNLGLNEVRLGRMVVFTDDDVLPDDGWLRAIHGCDAHWPELSVFGGRIEPVWPGGHPPFWSADPFIAGVFYGRLDLSDRPCLFPKNRFPAGANFWVRREVFANGLRYNEEFGPGSNSSQGASETTFLADLARKGHAILFVPGARVGHCVQETQMTMDFLKYRAGRCGRTGPHLDGLSLLWCHRRWPRLWRVLRWCSYLRYAVKYHLSRCSPFPRQRVKGIVKDWWGMENNLEQLRLAAGEYGPSTGQRAPAAVLKSRRQNIPELDEVGPR